MPILRPGSKVGGYEILAFHGKGGMGEIYRAKQLSIGREVALKILHPELVRKDPTFANKFHDEAKAAGRLSHPNIIAVHDVGSIKVAGRDEHLHYFSMEFVDGRNYRHIVEKDGPLDQDDLKVVMSGMAEALVYAERVNMVHRDIKPENIMITTDGRVKLADFGLAMQCEDSAEDEQRDENGRVKVMGTPRYMSPEQARGRTVDTRSDQYSLGATLFHFLTGQPPYDGSKARELMKAHVFSPVPDPAEHADVPRAWRQITRRLMAKDPDDRYASAVEMHTAIMAAAQGAPAPRGRTRRPRGNNTGTGGRSGELSGHRQATSSAKGLKVGIAIGVVVLVGFIGLRFIPKTPINTPPQALPQVDNTPGPQTVEAKGPEERAQEFIDNLPEDPSTAINRLRSNGGLGSAYFNSNPSARQMLQDRLDVLVAQVDRERERLLEEWRSVIDRARAQASSQLIKKAQETLNSRSDDPPAILRPDIKAVETIILRNELDLIGQHKFSIESASDMADLDAAEKRLAIKLVSDSGRKRLGQIVDARRKELSEQSIAENQKIKEKMQASWALFLKSLPNLRGENGSKPKTSELRLLVRQVESDLKGDAKVTHLENAKKLIADYQAMDTALDAFSDSNETFHLVDGREAKVTGRSGQRLDFLIVESDIPTGLYLGDRQIPITEVLKRAATMAELPNPDTATTAWMWLCDHPRTGSVLTDSGPYSNFFVLFPEISFEAENVPEKADPTPEPPTQSGAETEEGITDFRFANLGPEVIKDFTVSAGDLALDKGALVWSCEEQSAVDTRKIPALRLSENLNGKTLVRTVGEADNAEGTYLMVGVDRGDKGARLTLWQDDTGPLVAIYSVTRGSPSVVLNGRHIRLRNALDVTLAIDDDGNVTFAIPSRKDGEANIIEKDGKPVTVELGGSNNMSFCVQTLITKKGRSKTVSIERLLIEEDGEL